MWQSRSFSSLAECANSYGYRIPNSCTASIAAASATAEDHTSEFVHDALSSSSQSSSSDASFSPVQIAVVALMASACVVLIIGGIVRSRNRKGYVYIHIFIYIPFVILLVRIPIHSLP